MISIKQKIATNTVISFAGKIISSIFGVVSVAFIARELGPDGFGNYNIVVAFLYIFSVFADFGLYNLLTRNISRPLTDERRIVSEIFTARIILLLFFYVLSFLVVLLIPSYSSDVKLGVFITSLGFLFLSLAQVLMGVFQKYLKTILPAMADISARAIQLILVLYLYNKGSDFIDFLLVFVLGSFVNFILVYFFAKKYVPFKLSINTRSFLKILRQSWPLAVSSILVLIYFKGDTLILSFLKPPEDVGIYNMAYKVIETMIFFPAMFVGIVMPLLSRYFIESLRDFKKVFQKSFDFLNIISVPLVLGGAYLAKDIIHLIGGAEFSDSVMVFRVLLFALFFMFLGALFGNAIIAMNKQKKVMLAYGAAAVFNVVLNIFFIERYSYMGAAFVTVGTEILVTFLMFNIIRNTINYTPKLKVLIKSILASIFMVLVMWLLPFYNFFILFFAGCATYFLFMYFIKGVSREDAIMFLRFRNNR